MKKHDITLRQNQLEYQPRPAAAFPDQRTQPPDPPQRPLATGTGRKRAHRGQLGSCPADPRHNRRPCALQPITAMKLTQKAKDLIAKVESDRNRLHQAQSPITSIIPVSRKPAPQMKKAPQDLNRRKYSNWGGVDTFRFSGENRQSQPLTEYDFR